MAVTINDTRTVIDQADSLTGWTLADTLVTATYAEGSGCVAVAINIGTDQIYHTDAGTTDISDTMIYIWTLVVATRGSWTTGVHTLYLGDGTNAIGVEMAGDDKVAFAHSDDLADWQCFVVDGSQLGALNTAGRLQTYSGSYGSFDDTVVDEYGIGFITLSKALGGGNNCYVDIIRIGNGGIEIYGGTTGDRGTFLEIAVEDRSAADGTAYGIMRELTSGVYGCQGAITFGDADAANAAWFDDSNVVVAFEDRDVADDKYLFKVTGNSGATNTFILANSTIKSAGPGVTCEFDGGNVTTLTLTGVAFNDLLNSITFSNSADATGHDVTGCTFLNCGQIDPGDVTFTGNTISDSADAATGGLLIDGDGTTNMSGLNFISGGTGHGIYITTAGTYELTDFTYSGYAAQGGTAANRAVYNNSGGAVTLQISGGDSPSYRDGAGATTSIENTVPVKITTRDASDSSLVSSARVLLLADSGGDLPAEDSVSLSISTNTVTVTHTAHGLSNSDKVLILGVTNNDVYNGIQTISNVSTNAYDYTVTGSPASPTGTVTSTSVILDGTTTSGIIQDPVFNYTSNQPVTGRARKGTSATYYKNSITTGTITDAGLDVTVFLIKDE